MGIPNQPKIYHITHLRNLEQLASAGWLYSDQRRIQLGLNCQVVGMSAIKTRRLTQINVSCHPGTTVGQYAPFYFCPRSIMLFLLHRGNHPDLKYDEGQRPIVHLQADLLATIQWAKNNQIRWAFSDRNAGSFLASFTASFDQLETLDWDAIASTDFANPLVKEGKQAEFLMFDAFPWNLVEEIGVIDTWAAREVNNVLAGANHQPPVTIQHQWYY